MTKHDRGEKAFRNAQRKGRRFAPKSQRSRLTYAAAVALFAETEDCTPVELVSAHPRCRQIARQFSKPPEDVAKDISRVYIESYRQ